MAFFIESSVIKGMIESWGGGSVEHRFDKCILVSDYCCRLQKSRHFINYPAC